MLDNMLIVSTAVSSFNNAALVGPFFLVAGLFTLPLLFVIYVYGHDFVTKLGWNNSNLDNQISFWTSFCLLLWLMLFGGNYAVMRDGISLLPVLMALILFVLTIIAVQKSFQLNLVQKLKSKRLRFFVFILLLLMAVCSGVWTWWGVLLQISALLCGMIIGSRLKRNIILNPWVVFVLLMSVSVVLMQPEFFRFGQLGNLTIVHVLGVLFVGWCAITALVTKYTNARGRIHHSAYIKLKWLFRIVSLLAFALFVMTESVPVFFGLLASLGLLEMLSVYHSKHISRNICRWTLAWLLIGFGVIIICPVISALGVIYMTFDHESISIKDVTNLL
jgi:hypothetical protein